MGSVSGVSQDQSIPSHASPNFRMARDSVGRRPRIQSTVIATVRNPATRGLPTAISTIEIKAFSLETQSYFRRQTNHDVILKARFHGAANIKGTTGHARLPYAQALYQYAQVLRKLDKPAEAEAQLAAFREITAKEPPRNRR